MPADVTGIITQAQSYADDAVANANAFITTLRELTDVDFSVALPTLWTSSIFDRTEQALDDVRDAQPASPAQVDITIPFVAEPSISIRTPAEITVPDFDDGSKPVISYSDKPDTQLPDVPIQPPINEPLIPVKPAYDLPTVPTLSDIALPSIPTVNYPIFEATAPVDRLVTPSNNFAYSEVVYSSELLTEAEAALLDNIQNGGYGIEPDDESRLWNRARDRENANAKLAQEEVRRQFSATGFKMPTGALLNALLAAADKALMMNSSVNRDIAIKRGDLYVDNRKFTIERILQLETVLIGYHGALMERSLNAQRYILQASIDVFNAEVSKYNAQLDAYRTEAQVFGEKIRALVAQIQIYSAQVEAEKVKTDINNNLINLYKAQIDSVNAILDAYRTDIAAANALMDIEKTKIDAWKAQIDAYKSQVQAKVSEFSMWEAEVNGEKTKMQVFSEEVKAYGIEVDALKTRADIEFSKVGSDVETTKAYLMKYDADITKARAELEAKVQESNQIAEMYKADIAGWGALSEAITDVAKLGTITSELNIKTSIATSEISIQRAKIELEQLFKEAEIKMTAATAGADVYKSLAMGALSAVNALASIIESTSS
jgi:hypothetical protein